MAPRLPEGWTAEQGPVPYSLQPGKTLRKVFTVRIPGGAKGDLYRVGGKTTYQGGEIHELHAVRVKL